MRALSRHTAPFRRREILEGYLFASPFILGFLVFIAFPMGWALVLMFQRYNLLSPPSFVGMENIQRLLSDPKVGESLYHTAYFALFSVPLQLLLAFGAAVLLNQPIRGRNFYRTALYIPVIVPIVVTAFIWQRAYHPEFGIVNAILGWFNIEPRAWLFEPELAKPAFIFMRIWVFGTQMVIFLAGLQSVPPTLLEAASIDGAGTLRRFWSVTVPLMTPIIFFNFIVGVIGNFQVFAPALIMTKGGPADSTLFMVLYIYRNAFEYSRLGYAAALSWVLFIVILLLTIVQFRISGRWVYYEND
jgi:multiple sugar transport system permease protein